MSARADATCGRQEEEQFEHVIRYHRPGMTGYLKFVKRPGGTPDMLIRSEWTYFSQMAYKSVGVF